MKRPDPVASTRRVCDVGTDSCEQREPNRSVPSKALHAGSGRTGTRVKNNFFPEYVSRVKTESVG